MPSLAYAAEVHQILTVQASTIIRRSFDHAVDKDNRGPGSYALLTASNQVHLGSSGQSYGS